MGPVCKGDKDDVVRKKCYDADIDYSTHVNNGLHRTSYYAQREEFREQRYEEGRSSIWECTRSIEFQHGILKSYGWGSSKREARNRCDHGLYEKMTGGLKRRNIDIIRNIIDNKSVKDESTSTTEIDIKDEPLDFEPDLEPHNLRRHPSICFVKCEGSPSKESNQADTSLPRVQMDGEVGKQSEQGLTSQNSSQQSNTIITRDEGEAVAEDTDRCDIATYLSAEKVFQFPDLIDRWMPLATLEIKTEQKVSDFVTTYYLPESLFTAANCAPNLVPFEAFIYSQLDIEMRFVVNAQRFQCGKIICSVKFDSYQADAMQNTAMAALNRPHVILDLACNNQGVLRIPFRYHRGFVRNVKNDANSKGIRPSKFASVYVQYLSPLRTGKDSATNMFIAPFYRFTRSKFAAMSYRVKVQMDLANDVINTAYKSSGLREVLSRFEKMAFQFGSPANRDKPVDYQSKILIPRPRMNFGTGKGTSDAQPLRNNPLSLTSCHVIQPYDDDPRTTTQIARIWGLRDTFRWKSDNAPGTELWASVVDPTSRSYRSSYTGTPTPLEYICGMYNFWSGSIEYRFDFVSNAFHTGTVMISIEFGRPVILKADMCSKASTYTKTFDLGEQKTVTVVVPYIYDTVWRRSTSTAFNPNFSIDATDAPTDATRNQAMGVRPESKTVIRVSVMNDLRPIQTTTQEIDVQVFMRAGESFIPHSLKQMSYVLTRESSGTDPFIDSFPRDNYKVGDDKRMRRAMQDPRTVQDYIRARNPRDAPPPTPADIREVSHKWLPEEISNEWNEYKPECIPVGKTQADQGEKEEQDPTQNFQHGRTLLHLQTTDIQTNIKDILRRPVLLIYKAFIEDNTTEGRNFFIPVMPPSREFNYHPNQKAYFSQLVGQTPQAALMNLFRFWRGSSRYTIFVHSGSAEPIYITYVPHTGTRIIGNEIIGNALKTTSKRPIMGCGLTTEPLLPVVNSSAVVEVPYDTENNWTLTFEEDTQRNYAWRDKGDTNAGHLVLTATSKVTFSVWWSAGDDFEVSNFYGIPECRNKDAEYQWSDAHGRVQMDRDFHGNEGRTFSSTLRSIRSEISKLADPKILAKVAVGSIPVVGPAAALAPVVLRAEEMAAESTKTMGDLQTTIKSVDETAKALSHITNQLAPLISTINSFFSASSANSGLQIWAERLIDFITDLSMAWFRKSWVDVGVTCMKLLSKILLVQINQISQYVGQFTEAIQGLAGYARTQGPSPTSTIVGALAGVVGLALGVKICQDRYTSYIQSLSKAFFQTSGISYINQVIRFVQTVFDILRDMIMEALGYKSPEAVALKMLSGKDLLLKNFIASAQSVINDANSSMILHPRFRTKFWYTVTQAYQIQQVLTMVPANVVSPQLGKLCTDVIKVGNERMMDLSCSPVRYEPFVVCIEGGHGIGKSHLTDKVVSHLLKAIGFSRTSSGWTYTRAPGSKFWSGYRDQPAIIYDDWLNLNDAQLMSQQISELYQLKSTSTFIPEMAHLEEKRIKANPMLVILLTNGAFPSGMANVAHHPDAVFRRRDVVLHAQVKTEFQGVNPRDLSEEDSLHVNHLEFSKYASACDPTSLGTVNRSFDETMAWLAQTFKRYHAQEEINVRTRVEVLRDQLQVDAAESFDFEDPFSLLYKSTEFISGPDFATNAWLPSEQLEAAVLEIVERIQERKQTPVQIVVPPSPDNIFAQYDCCPASWLELGKWFLRGAVLTVDVWSKIAKWSSEGLAHVLSTVLDWTHEPNIGECVVCNEEKELAYACVDSEHQHRVCAECWRNVQLLSPTVCCPICRSTNVALFLQRKDGILATVLFWLSQLGTKVLLPTVRAIARVLSRSSARAQSKLKLIGEMIVGMFAPNGMNTRALACWVGTVVSAEAVNPSETFYDAVEEIEQEAINNPGGTIVSSILLPAFSQYRHDQLHESHGHYHRERRVPLCQSDDDWEQPFIRDVRASIRTDPIGHCQLNPVGFQACRTPKVTILPQCYHHKLSENVDTIIYRDSQTIGPAWQLPIEINGRLENIFVLDYPCQHNCIWEDETVHRQFCELYIQRNQARIARAQIQYVSTLQANPIELLKAIPRFARPEWAVQEVLPVPLTQDNWWTYLSDTWKEYQSMLIVTGLIAGTMGAVYMTYSHISSWFTGPEVSPEVPRVTHQPDQQADPNYNPEHSRFIQRSQREIRPVRMPRTQGDNLADVVEGYIVKNYMRIVVTNESTNKVRYLTAIGLFNHYAALPRHYVKVLSEAKREGKKIEIAQAMVEWAGSKFTRQVYNYDASDFIVSTISDIAFFKVPASYKMFKDIRKFLTTQKDLNNYISSEGKIVLAPTRENQIAQVIPIQIKGYQHSAIFEDYDQSHIEAFHVLKYTFSKQGACGSLVCLENSQRPIIAMHCAGQGDGIYGVGWGVLMTQESIAEMLPQNIVVQCEEVDHSSLEGAKFIFDEECQVEYIGTVPPNLQPHIPQKTKIEKSLLHTRFGFKSMTEPTILSPQDPRYTHELSPLYYGARKHGIKTKDFTSTMVKRAKEALWTRWLSGMEPIVVDPKKLTPEEAVLGFVGNKYYEALSLNTSAGYPWSLGGQTTKDSWIETNWEQRTCVIHPQLLKEIERKEQLRKEGIVPETIFVDTLKDERKRSDKIKKQGATRVFCASPVDYTIALRQSMLHFCAAYMKNRHTQMHAVGIDVHAEEWARLWSRLTKHGYKFIGLDYSNFGPAFNAVVAQAASELMKRWTLKYVGGVDEIELDALNWECDQSLHLCGNTLYRQQCGSPSGAAITVIKNTLVNHLYVMVAWEALCRQRVLEEAIDVYDEFAENCEVCAYGDDLVMTVSDKYIDIFNMRTIQEWFAQYGIVSTDASKSGGEVKEWVSKEEITFLKRGWKPHPTRPYQYLSPLDMVSVNDITQWIWKSPDRRMATRVNCESALLEAHSQGPEVYEVLREKINTGLEKLSIAPITMNWYDVDNKYYTSPMEVGATELWG